MYEDEPHIDSSTDTQILHSGFLNLTLSSISPSDSPEEHDEVEEKGTGHGRQTKVPSIYLRAVERRSVCVCGVAGGEVFLGLHESRGAVLQMMLCHNPQGLHLPTKLITLVSGMNKQISSKFDPCK